MSTLFVRRIFDFFLFSSLFMAVCTVVMVYQGYTLLVHKNLNPQFVSFVFFSTICSYNFHWMLTPSTAAGSGHITWSIRNKTLHFVFFLAGVAGAAFFFFILKEFWMYLGFAVVLTFLYTAPKIPLAPFRWLKKIAIGKTIFLSMMWVYVTTVLPVLIENSARSTVFILFITAQFFFIFSICIIFDFRDREHDKAEHIISLITYLSERGVDRLFFVSVICYSAIYLYLLTTGFPWLNILLLLIPAPVLAGTYSYAKKNYSDYLYYFLLDGLMMLPGLLLWLVNRF